MTWFVRFEWYHTGVLIENRPKETCEKPIAVVQARGDRSLDQGVLAMEIVRNGPIQDIF